MKKIFLLILMIPALNGCLGAGYLTFYPNKKAIDVSGNLTKTEILRTHGSPDEIKIISEAEEILVYRQGLGWSGFIPFIGLGAPIPVPFVVPTHSKWTKIHIYDNKAHDIIVNFTDSDICFAGYGSEDSGLLYHWMGKCKNRSTELFKNGKEPFQND